jgi:hypothetical protein
MTSEKGYISPEEEKKMFEKFGIMDASKVFPGLTDKNYVDPLDKETREIYKKINTNASAKKGGKRRTPKRRTNKRRTIKRKTIKKRK